MIDKPLHWFQIHLSTAIVLMFVRGGLMRGNYSFRTIDLGDQASYTISMRSRTKGNLAHAQKKRTLRFHLSTLLLFVVFIGLLLKANIFRKPEVYAYRKSYDVSNLLVVKR